MVGMESDGCRQLPGWTKAQHPPLRTHASLNICTSLPSSVVVKSLHLVGCRPWVLYSALQAAHGQHWCVVQQVAGQPR